MNGRGISARSAFAAGVGLHQFDPSIFARVPLMHDKQIRPRRMRRGRQGSRSRRGMLAQGGDRCRGAPDIVMAGAVAAAPACRANFL